MLNLKSVFLPEKTLIDKNNNNFIEDSINPCIKEVPFFDPYAVKEINKIIKLLDAKVVITDGWFFTSDLNRTKKWCEVNKLELHFHRNMLTPKKMSSSRAVEIRWWIEENKKDNLVLIIDEHYTTANVYEKAIKEECEYIVYKNKYDKYLGNNRRKNLIPSREYKVYENYLESHVKEEKRLIHIDEKIGLDEKALYKCLSIIKKQGIQLD